ncbi:MAG: hypothetical protein HY645_13720 [Acidobacteria bacterium]|nr:hypothetical protein [Acidobacteriota bacterium]
MRMYLLFIFLMPAVSLAQTLDDVIVPSKTEMFVEIERAINTRTAKSGDKFYARLAVPLTINDKIILPVGTFLLGYVGEAKRAGYLKGKASLDLKFDTVILPDGITRRMEAIIQSAEGAEKSADEKGSLEGSGSQGKETAAGAAGGAVTGGIVGAVSGRSWKGLGAGTAIGAAGGAIIGIFKRGKDVSLPRGASVTIQLTDDVRFSKPESPPAGTRLDY